MHSSISKQGSDRSRRIPQILQNPEQPTILLRQKSVFIILKAGLNLNLNIMCIYQATDMMHRFYSTVVRRQCTVLQIAGACIFSASKKFPPCYPLKVVIKEVMEIAEKHPFLHSEIQIDEATNLQNCAMLEPTIIYLSQINTLESASLESINALVNALHVNNPEYVKKVATTYFWSTLFITPFHVEYKSILIEVFCVWKALQATEDSMTPNWYKKFNENLSGSILNALNERYIECRGQVVSHMSDCIEEFIQKFHEVEWIERIERIEEESRMSLRSAQVTDIVHPKVNTEALMEPFSLADYPRNIDERVRKESVGFRGCSGQIDYKDKPSFDESGSIKTDFSKATDYTDLLESEVPIAKAKLENKKTFLESDIVPPTLENETETSGDEGLETCVITSDRELPPMPCIMTPSVGVCSRDLNATGSEYLMENDCDSVSVKSQVLDAGPSPVQNSDVGEMNDVPLETRKNKSKKIERKLSKSCSDLSKHNKMSKPPKSREKNEHRSKKTHSKKEYKLSQEEAPLQTNSVNTEQQSNLEMMLEEVPKCLSPPKTPLRRDSHSSNSDTLSEEAIWRLWETAQGGSLAKKDSSDSDSSSSSDTDSSNSSDTDSLLPSRAKKPKCTFPSPTSCHKSSSEDEMSETFSTNTYTNSNTNENDFSFQTPPNNRSEHQQSFHDSNVNVSRANPYHGLWPICIYISNQIFVRNITINQMNPDSTRRTNFLNIYQRSRRTIHFPDNTFHQSSYSAQSEESTFAEFNNYTEENPPTTDYNPEQSPPTTDYNPEQNRQYNSQSSPPDHPPYYPSPQYPTAYNPQQNPQYNSQTSPPEHPPYYPSPQYPTAYNPQQNPQYNSQTSPPDHPLYYPSPQYPSNYPTEYLPYYSPAYHPTQYP